MLSRDARDMEQGRREVITAVMITAPSDLSHDDIKVSLSNTVTPANVCLCDVCLLLLFPKFTNYRHISIPAGKRYDMICFVNRTPPIDNDAK